MSLTKSEKGEMVDKKPNMFCFCCGCGFVYTDKKKLKEGQRLRCPYCGSFETKKI